MAKALSTLAVGALVKDTGTLYNGKPIIWKIADKNHAGYPANSVTLITERIISLKCFDAIESGNSDSNRRSYGNNRWIYSNIRQWLNSGAAAGQWYSAQHSADAPPANANVWSNYNEYDGEAGFLAGFSANFLAALLNTTHTVGKASVDGGGTETCTDKIFFATCTEVGLTGDHTCGSKLALFTDNASRQAKPTAECVSKSEYTNSSFNANSFWYWWLADAYASNSYIVRNVHSSGELNNYYAFGGYGGARPLCNLKSEILVSDTPDSDGAYTIIGALIVLAVEFVSGCVLNLWLGLGVWDYSNQPGNVLGQICPAFGLLWFFIMPFAIWAEDTARWLIWAYECAVFGKSGKPPGIMPYSVTRIYKDFFCWR